MTPISEFNFQQVLEIENDEAILDFTCAKTGLLLWPLVRMPFLRFIISDWLFNASLQDIHRRRVNRNTLPTLVKATIHNATHRPRTVNPVMIMGTGVGNYMKDDAWFNRLTDYFYFAEAEKTLVVEDSFEWRWPYPRHNKNVLFHAPIQVASLLMGKIGHKDFAKATSLITFVRERARRQLGWELGDERAAYLTRQVAIQAAAIPFKRRAYQKLLSTAGTRLLIKEEACYGSSSVLMSTAKEMGIVTAEYQHGLVSSGHIAYNIAPVLVANHMYRKTLPDYFLSYGNWWNEQINVPVTKIPIGNPHRAEQLHVYRKNDGCSSQNDILILGNGFETQMYLELAMALSQRLRGKFRVVFRPHPFERSGTLKNTSLISNADLTIDQHQNIYQSFETAYAVVGEHSTGLFEAIGLARKIYAWDTFKTRFSIAGHPFIGFKHIDDLVQKLGDSTNAEVEESEIWAANWQSSYLDFLSSTLPE